MKNSYNHLKLHYNTVKLNLLPFFFTQIEYVVVFFDSWQWLQNFFMNHELTIHDVKYVVKVNSNILKTRMTDHFTVFTTVENSQYLLVLSFLSVHSVKTSFF